MNGAKFQFDHTSAEPRFIDCCPVETKITKSASSSDRIQITCFTILQLVDLLGSQVETSCALTSYSSGSCCASTKISVLPPCCCRVLAPVAHRELAHYGCKPSGRPQQSVSFVHRGGARGHLSPCVHIGVCHLCLTRVEMLFLQLFCEFVEGFSLITE